MKSMFWYKYWFLKIVILDTLKTRNTNELLKLNSLLEKY